MTSAPSTDRFSVLVVCTGNICRSPVAEQVMRARFGEGVASFRSAGTAALVGGQMPEPAHDLARRLGATPNVHEPRQLSAQQIDAADLVFALTREHRAAVVRESPRAHRKTVTLREAARLLESLIERPDLDRDLAALRDRSRAATLRDLVPLALAERGFATVAHPDDDDVVDPYAMPQELYDRSGAQIIDAIDRIEIALLALRARLA